MTEYDLSVKLRWYRANRLDVLTQKFFLCEFLFKNGGEVMRDLAAARQEIDEIDEHLITCLAKRQRLLEEAEILNPKNDLQAVNAQ